VKLKSGQFVFLHDYPKELERDDITPPLLEFDIIVRFVEFTSSGVVIVLKSFEDKLQLMNQGFIQITSQNNPEISFKLKFYWDGELPQPDPPFSMLSESKWSMTKNSQLNQLFKLINSSSKIVAFTAEGLPDELGIPNFRYPPGVDWEIVNLFTKSNLLNIDNTEIREKYWQYHTESYEKFQSAIPSDAHKLLSYLVDKGKLQCVITQNIDGLHERDIKDSSKIININGSELEVSCDHCKHPCDRQGIHQAIKSNLYLAPLCPNCDQPLKTSILAFDEPINQSLLRKAIQYIQQSDLFLILGSALMISPSCQLLDLTTESSTQIVLINSTNSIFDNAMALAINGEIKSTCQQILSLLQGRETTLTDRKGDVKMGTRSSRILNQQNIN